MIDLDRLQQSTLRNNKRSPATSQIPPSRRTLLSRQSTNIINNHEDIQGRSESKEVSRQEDGSPKQDEKW